ncbi:MAG: hypothetical protein OEU54_10965 [Gemmatimonadota bacterium]|nr:hypothetical protein [Gemmatimonadota bacterium]
MSLRTKGLLAAVVAGGSLVVGALALKWYVWDIAIGQAGEPDRSMLFWGLPIVFIGVVGLALGCSLAIYARRRLSEHHTSD